MQKIKKQFASLIAYLPTSYHKLWRLVRPFASRVKPWKRYLTRKNVLLTGSIGLAMLALTYSGSLFWPRTVTFSYAKNSCFTNPVLLPNLISKKQSPTYMAITKTTFSVMGYPVYSQVSCVKPTGPPTEHTAEIINFGTPLMKKNIKVSSGAFPSLASQAKLERPVATQAPLVLEMDSADQVFDYRLWAGDKSLECSKQKNSVVCEIAKLNLAQSAKYDFSLERLFDGVPAGTVFKRQLATVESVSVTASSIAREQTVYDIPTELTISLNRSAVAIQGAHLYLLSGDSRQEVAATTSLNDKTVTVRFEKPLARSASFIFTVENITAADGGFLATPVSLPFKTSGGPKVLGLNIGASRVATSSNIILTFDSPLSKTQALQNFVRLEVGGNVVAATISAGNNTITIKPQSPLPRCSAFTVKVIDGLQNSSGISGGSAWQYKSRTICQTVFSIGTSVQGRSITAYSFGTGPSKIVFIGTLHGDEKSSTYLLNKWIDYLETNYDKIPSHHTIVVIPNINPDGYALNRRTNANNVDLNRNFPANNWKSGVTMPDQSYNPSGGGSAPLSEPESKALANYILSQNPRLVLSYHAVAGVVIPNDAGDSVALAHTYDQKSNVGFLSNSQTGGVFKYDTTGAFEDWLHDKPGIPALLIELWSKSGNEYTKHQAAMLYMSQLP